MVFSAPNGDKTEEIPENRLQGRSPRDLLCTLKNEYGSRAFLGIKCRDYHILGLQKRAPSGVPWECTGGDGYFGMLWDVAVFENELREDQLTVFHP